MASVQQCSLSVCVEPERTLCCQQSERLTYAFVYSQLWVWLISVVNTAMIVAIVASDVQFLAKPNQFICHFQSPLQFAFVLVSPD